MNTEMLKHHCVNCMKPIPNVVFACDECTDFELCMQCYVCGAEIGPHKRTHGFKMIDLGTFRLFKKTKKWNENSKRIDTEMESGSEEKQKESGLLDNEHVSENSSELIDDGTEYFSDDDEEDGEPSSKSSGHKHHRYYYELERGQLIKKFDKSPEKVSKPNRVWRALDELELLEAVSRFGYGNWKDIAQALSFNMKGITPEEVADHYAIHYILTDIGDYTWDWKANIDHVVETIKVNDARKCSKPTEGDFRDIPKVALDSVGYMPKRDDFEREFDNDVESIVANLTAGLADDDELETKFKLAQIDMFQLRLLERFRKKTIVRKYGLVRKFLLENPENKDIADNASTSQVNSTAFSPFLRFNTKNGLQELFLDLQKEYSLKVIIRKLLNYKRLGLKKLSEIKEYEERRQKELTEKSRQSSLIDTDDSQNSDEETNFTLDETNLERLLAMGSLLSSDKLQEILSAILQKEDEEDGTLKHETKVEIKSETQSDEDQMGSDVDDGDEEDEEDQDETGNNVADDEEGVEGEEEGESDNNGEERAENESSDDDDQMGKDRQTGTEWGPSPCKKYRKASPNKLEAYHLRKANSILK